MGKTHSSNINMNNALLFSNFCKHLKTKNNRSFVQKFQVTFQWRPDSAKLESCVLIWSIDILCKSQWNRFQPYLKNRVMRDLIDTLYKKTSSFDGLFMLLLCCCRLSKICNRFKNSPSWSCDLHVGEDVLRYAFVHGVKYSHRDGNRLENVIDFPLRLFHVCGCSRRPLYVAMVLNRPDIVRILLNCGARIPLEYVCVCSEDRWHPLSNVLDIYKRAFLTCSEGDISTINFRKRCSMCLRTLLVDLPHTTSLKKLVTKFLEEMSGGDGIVTESVPTLKHITRTRIRMCMKSNRWLCKMDALTGLGLPETLVDYLRIEEKMTFQDLYTLTLTPSTGSFSILNI